MRLIDADALVKVFQNRCTCDCSCCELFDSLSEECGLINDAPTIELSDIELHGYVNGEQITKIKSSKPDRPTWKWIQKCDDNFDWYECSCCGYGNEGELQERPWFKFCPCCGAKMKGADK